MTTEKERPILYDSWCGEPVAWQRSGDPILDRHYDPRTGAYTEVTRRLTPQEALEKYGPVTRLVLGIGGGFETVIFGEKTFVTKYLDPRPRTESVMRMEGGTAFYDYIQVGGVPFDESCTEVNDPVTDNYPCPKCGAAKGQHCQGVKTRHRAREQAANVSH